MDEVLLNPREAAEFLRVTWQTLANWRHNKCGPNYRKLGGKILYHENDLNQFIDSSLVDTTGGTR